MKNITRKKASLNEKLNSISEVWIYQRICCESVIVQKYDSEKHKQALGLFTSCSILIHLNKNVAYYNTILFRLWVIIYWSYKNIKWFSCMWLIYNQDKPKHVVYIYIYIWLIDWFHTKTWMNLSDTTQRDLLLDHNNTNLKNSAIQHSNTCVLWKYGR